MKTAAVCDTSPCLNMRRMLERLLVRSLHPGHKDDLVLVAMSNRKVQTEVWLVYCPFCGTRIEPEWISRARRILET